MSLSAGTAADAEATIGQRLRAVRRRLSDAGIANAGLDARLLLAYALQVPVTTLIAHPERPVDSLAAARLESVVRRREAREPLSRIRGEREFWGLPFLLSPATLDPRPDSETLVAAALAGMVERERCWRILDLGTGSGCLLLALLAERPQAWGVGIDRSAAALQIARENARRLGLAQRARFVCADWTSPINASFDVIVANPPYIDDKDWLALAPEVALFDPRSALDGGEDGLEACRALLPGLGGCLTQHGVAWLEIDPRQEAAVRVLAAECGLICADTAADLSGRTRGMALRPVSGLQCRKRLETHSVPTSLQQSGLP